VGASNADNFTYQARAFLDQVAGVTEPLPTCATFADALRTMEIIRAVVESSLGGGAAVTIPPAV
jgi:predicted dehydrogenase